ncbi:MAG: PQQ-dependent sugar dehydrogenase [Deltaproteobacteria bacterium]
MLRHALLFASSALLITTACSGGDDDLSDDIVARDGGEPVTDGGDGVRDGGDGVRDGGDEPGRDAGFRDGGPRDGGPLAMTGLDQRPSNPTCVAPAPPNDAQVQITTSRVFQSAGNFNRPLFMTQAPGDTSNWYLMEQSGTVYRFEDTTNPAAATTVIDLTGVVDDGPNEAGLLGMAFHPDFATNRYVVFSYTERVNNQLTSRIVRYTANAMGTSIDPNSASLILEVEQPYGNHNGGMIAFGPDGYLYIALGDGGSGGDPLGSGQNINTLLGAILRIDIDSGSPYASPATNPFVGTTGRDEIFAYGLRNPWRFSFDSVTGELWAGDVGQNALEEVDIVELGGNYGWNIREGDRCYGSPNCDSAGLIDPVAVYGRSEGVSITGGYVYRGTQIPELAGVYLYADFGSGRMWGLFEDPSTGELVDDVVLNTGNNIASFAEGADGELYILTFDGGIRRIESNTKTPVDPFPSMLSQTGCVDTMDATQPAAGLIPYTVTAPLWSDGADKQRWMAVPDGETITIDADGDFDFPTGTVLMKEFTLNGRRVETRLFMRHPSGQWAGYTYAWNQAETDAQLTESSVRVDVNGTSWRIPSRGECMTCHTAAAGRSLGLELLQLNAPQTYPTTGRTANQIATLSSIGMFDTAPADPSTLPSLAAYDNQAATADDRARSYFHSNCSNCHRTGGPAQGDLDLHFTTALADTAMCDAPTQGAFGIADARVVTPGDPAASVLSFRMGTLEAPRMPPLASEVVDGVGTGVVDAWITGLGSCP